VLDRLSEFTRAMKRVMRKNNPIPVPFPLVTFPERTWSKFLFIYGPRLRISGGSPLGLATSGNALIRLNRSGPLGSKSDLIQVPEDGIIFKDVVRHGFWEPEESLFLAHGIQEVPSNQNSKTALIDIGANSGLITRQTLKFADTGCDVVLFEPLKKHTDAIEFNLRPYTNRHHIQIEQVGLSDVNSSAQLFTDLSNKGNSSVFQAAVADAQHEVTDITLVSTHEYFVNNLSQYDHLVLKCDTQGLDASILSKIPTAMWEKVQRAVIEVWAIPEIKATDVDALIPALESFLMLGWTIDSETNLAVADIREFWLSQSGESRNLFLSR
jgi:FkbM family methyltransferase